jgi:hypothetical protein
VSGEKSVTPVRILKLSGLWEANAVGATGLLPGTPVVGISPLRFEANWVDQLGDFVGIISTKRASDERVTLVSSLHLLYTFFVGTMGRRRRKFTISMF